MHRNILLPLLALLCAAGTLIAEDQTLITGKVVGSDGKPMPKAHVHIHRPGWRRPLVTAEADANGTFVIGTERAGHLLLRVTGVGHTPYDVPLLIDAPRMIALNVRLAPRQTGTSFDDVKIIGDFNDFDFTTGKTLRREKNGTYTATFKTPEKAFAYQLLFHGDTPEAFSMNGTQSEDYIYDGDGDYRSLVMTKNGGVTITFDPRKLPRADRPAEVTYLDSVTARLAGAFRAMDRHTEMAQEARNSHMASGKEMADFRYDWSNDMKSLLAQAGRESDPTVRNALLLEYLHLTSLGGGPADPEVARRLLTDLAPGSGLWSYEPSLVETAIAASGDPQKYDAYRWAMIESAPDTADRVGMLQNNMLTALGAKQSDLMMRYYNYLVTRYPATSEARWARAEFDPNRNIMVGKKVPDFALTSLDNPSEKLTSQSMRGRYYMIDFWATWCGPCVGEMEGLHKAYEKFHSRNFEILSLSFDGRPKDVSQFRSAKWKMPWRHAFVEGNFDSELAQRFEVVGIPKPILVDGNGMIVAAGDELRGEDLDRTLERVLGTPN